MSKAPQIFKNFIPATVRVIGADSLAGQRLLSNNLGRIRQFYTTQRGIADIGVISLNRGMIDAPEITMTYKKIQGQEYVDVILRPVNPLTVVHPHKFDPKPHLGYMVSSAFFNFSLNAYFSYASGIHLFGQIPPPSAIDPPGLWQGGYTFVDGTVYPTPVNYLADEWRSAFLAPYPGYNYLRDFLYSTNPSHKYQTENDLIGLSFDDYNFMDTYGNPLGAPNGYRSHTSVIKPTTIPGKIYNIPYRAGWRDIDPWLLPGGVSLPNVPAPPLLPRPKGWVGVWNPGPNLNLDGWFAGPAVLINWIYSYILGLPPRFTDPIDVTPLGAAFNMGGFASKDLPFVREKGTIKFVPIGFYGIELPLFGNSRVDILFKRVTPFSPAAR